MHNFIASKLTNLAFSDFREPFYKILVPTVDTVRYNYLVNTLVAGQNPVLITGPVGTGKTTIVQDVLYNLDKDMWSYLIINMSAQVYPPYYYSFIACVAFAFYRLSRH